jgi:hypothetical protein
MKNDKEKKNEEKSPEKPLKPKNPNTKGAPDDKDPDSQYEHKEQS